MAVAVSGIAILHRFITCEQEERIMPTNEIARLLYIASACRLWQRQLAAIGGNRLRRRAGPSRRTTRRPKALFERSAMKVLP
jgi:hypothetical protein